LSGNLDSDKIVQFQVLVNATWILIPLIPSILTYLIAPNRAMVVTGPLAGLTIKATGAFAAYVIVLLLAYPLINNQNKVFAQQLDHQYVDSAERRAWIVRGSVIVQDENANPAPTSDKVGIEVSLNPDIINLNQNTRDFEIIVPEIDQRIPRIRVRYPGFGEATINPGRPDVGQMVTSDKIGRTITINSPLIIRRIPCQGLQC
jgi:hypothetical protein